jgi:hypothetical protein
MASVKGLRSLFERFQGKDDDVDWILSSGMLSKRLSVNPDRDLRDVWKVQPEAENPHWKLEQAGVQDGPPRPQTPLMDHAEDATANREGMVTGLSHYAYEVNGQVWTSLRRFTSAAFLHDLIELGPAPARTVRLTRGGVSVRAVGRRGDPFDQVVTKEVVFLGHRFRILNSQVFGNNARRALEDYSANFPGFVIPQAGLAISRGLAFEYIGPDIGF